MTKIILAAPCMGKTTYATNNPHIAIDLESSDYLFNKSGFEHLSSEEFKGVPNRKRNPNGVKDYLAAIKQAIESQKHRLIFTSSHPEVAKGIIPMGNEFMASTQHVKIEAIIQSNFYSAILKNCKSEEDYKASEFYNVLTQIHNRLQNYEPILYNDYAYYLNKLLNQHPNKKLIEIRDFINNHHISEIKGGNHDV